MSATRFYPFVYWKPQNGYFWQTKQKQNECDRSDLSFLSALSGYLRTIAFCIGTVKTDQTELMHGLNSKSATLLAKLNSHCDAVPVNKLVTMYPGVTSLISSFSFQLLKSVGSYVKLSEYIIIRFLINVQVQGHHPHQWAPFQVTG